MPARLRPIWIKIISKDNPKESENGGKKSCLAWKKRSFL